MQGPRLVVVVVVVVVVDVGGVGVEIAVTLVYALRFGVGGSAFGSCCSVAQVAGLGFGIWVVGGL